MGLVRLWNSSPLSHKNAAPWELSSFVSIVFLSPRTITLSTSILISPASKTLIFLKNLLFYPIVIHMVNSFRLVLNFLDFLNSDDPLQHAALTTYLDSQPRIYHHLKQLHSQETNPSSLYAHTQLKFVVQTTSSFLPQKFIHNPLWTLLIHFVLTNPYYSNCLRQLTPS